VRARAKASRPETEFARRLAAAEPLQRKISSLLIAAAASDAAEDPAPSAEERLPASLAQAVRAATADSAAEALTTASREASDEAARFRRAVAAAFAVLKTELCSRSAEEMAAAAAGCARSSSNRDRG
jgi:hypothetical protein